MTGMEDSLVLLALKTLRPLLQYADILQNVQHPVAHGFALFNCLVKRCQFDKYNNYRFRKQIAGRFFSERIFGDIAVAP